MEHLNNYNDFQEQEINLKDYLRIFLHYKWLIFSIFVAVVAITIIYTINSPKIYKSSCRILIEDQKNNDFFFAAQSFGGGSSINNNIEILKSYPVLESAFNIMKKHPQFKTFPMSEAVSPIDVLLGGITVESKRETDVLVISFESTNPVEAQAAVNAAAEALKQQNTTYAKVELTNTREFLGDQLDLIKSRYSSYFTIFRST